MAGSRRFRLRGCIVDLDQQAILRDGETVALTGQEAAVLAYLAERRGQVVSRDALYTDVLGYSDGTRSRALDAAIRRVRRKIEVDPNQPENLLNVWGEGYRLVVAPPSPALGARRYYTDRFVGRAGLVARLGQLVADRPCVVTVHGPGGVGKTRLVHEALDRPIRLDVPARADAGELAAAVAAAMGLPASDHTGAAAALALAARGEVLVLDGAEVAVAGVGDLVASWMRSGAAVAVVVTSREPLALSFEQVLAVEPLDEDEAIALLADRARRALGERSWAGADEGALRALADALDGLPLALELAAGRAPVLSAPAVLERLQDRFAVLRSARRDAAGHHATLWGTLHGSWELLEPPGQSALVRLAALEAPFPYEVGEAVIEPDPVGALDAVQGLVDRSLLCPPDDLGRLRMLDSVRAFAREQASAEPWAEHHEAARRRLAEVGHQLPLEPADRRRAAELALGLDLPSLVPAVCAALRTTTDARWGVDLAERARPRVEGRGLLELAAAAGSTLVRAGPADVTDAWIEALDALALDDPTAQLEHLTTTSRLLAVRGHLAEAMRRLEQAVELAGADRRVELLVDLGTTASAAGLHHRSKEVLERARATAVPGSGLWARATVRLSTVVRAVERDAPAAERLLREGYEAHRALGQEAEAALALGNLGNALQRRADLRGAIDHYQPAIEILDRVGDLRTAAICRKNLGLVWDALGIGEPLRVVEAAVLAHELLGDRRNWALDLAALADLQARHGDPERGLATSRRALRAMEEIGGPLVPVALTNLAHVLALLGRDDEVEAVLARAVDLLPPEGGEPQIELMVVLARGELCAERDPERSASDLERVRRLFVRLRGEEALSAQWHIAAARVALARGEPGRAREHVDAGRARLVELTVEPTAWVWRRLDALRDRALADHG